MASSPHMNIMAHTCTFSHCSVVSTSLIFPFRFLFADKRRRLTEGVFTVLGFFSTQYQIFCSFHVESSLVFFSPIKKQIVNRSFFSNLLSGSPSLSTLDPLSVPSSSCSCYSSGSSLCCGWLPFLCISWTFSSPDTSVEFQIRMHDCHPEIFTWMSPA